MLFERQVDDIEKTFKEDCPDTRNSKIFDLMDELLSYGVQVVAHDPVADTSEVEKHYGITLQTWDALCALDIDTCIIAVGHDFYRQGNLECRVCPGRRLAVLQHLAWSAP